MCFLQPHADQINHFPNVQIIPNSSQLGYQHPNKVIREIITEHQLMEMSTDDSNCEVMVKPHNDSGKVRENLQNDRVRIFHDIPDC